VVGHGACGRSYDFAAEGDKGQFIYVSPQKKLVIVRHGLDFGIPTQAWLALFYDFASQYSEETNHETFIAMARITGLSGSRPALGCLCTLPSD
jgi:hypothetical protein